MIVDVSSCYLGHDTFGFILTHPSWPSHIVVRGDDWTRDVASYALDEVMRMTSRRFTYRRSNIRFSHR